MRWVESIHRVLESHTLSLRWLGISLKPLLPGKTTSLRTQEVCNFGIQFYSVSEQSGSYLDRFGC
jgi:hypothetical protein